MSEWAAKRFWQAADVVSDEAGFSVTLDGRAVKTPLKAPLVLPSQEMAQAIALEWDAQDGVIDPTSMPVTRSANAAIDKVSLQHGDVVDMLAAYAETDLLCHRADGPEALVARQHKHWQPLLDWGAQTHNAPLVVTTGILPAMQPQNSLDSYRKRIAEFRPFSLTALHDLIMLSGSLVLGLAVAARRIQADDAWDISRIDETFQIEQWGEDEDAMEAAALKQEAFRHAERFLRLAQGH